MFLPSLEIGSNRICWEKEEAFPSADLNTTPQITHMFGLHSHVIDSLTRGQTIISLEYYNNKLTPNGKMKSTEGTVSPVLHTPNI